MIKKIITVGILLFMTGCASVPKGTSFISYKVTEGIQRIQVENEKIIKAFADVERAILDEKWNDIYLKTEKMYFDKNKIPSPSQLTHDDRRKIATNAALIRENVLNEISMQENKLIKDTQSNTNTVVMMNDEVIGYLNSLKSIGGDT